MQNTEKLQSDRIKSYWIISDFAIKYSYFLSRKIFANRAYKNIHYNSKNDNTYLGKKYGLIFRINFSHRFIHDKFHQKHRVSCTRERQSAIKIRKVKSSVELGKMWTFTWKCWECSQLECIWIHDFILSDSIPLIIYFRLDTMALLVMACFPTRRIPQSINRTGKNNQNQCKLTYLCDYLAFIIHTFPHVRRVLAAI